MKTTLNLIIRVVIILAIGAISSFVWKQFNTGKTSEGEVGEIFKTAFYNFTVDSVEFIDSYEDYIPTEGMQFVNVFVTVENTMKESQMMSITEFELQWNDIEADTAANKNTAYSYAKFDFETPTSGLMVEPSTLEKDTTAIYELLYQVPKEANDFSINVVEYYDLNGEEQIGNEHIVHFDKDGDTEQATEKPE